MAKRDNREKRRKRSKGVFRTILWIIIAIFLVGLLGSCKGCPSSCGDFPTLKDLLGIELPWEGLFDSWFGLAKDDDPEQDPDSDNTVDKPEEGDVPSTTFTVRISDAIVHGTLVSSASTVPSGGSVTLTATPDSGYRLSAIIVNGESVSLSSNVAVIDNVAQDLLVTATFTSDVECDHVDVDGNGFCDKCGIPIVVGPGGSGDGGDGNEGSGGGGDDGNGELEECSCGYPYDSGEDMICDNCGKHSHHNFTWETYCQCRCGYQFEHVFTDEGKCYYCETPVDPSDCTSHVDNDIDRFCDFCGACMAHGDGDRDCKCDYCGVEFHEFTEEGFCYYCGQLESGGSGDGGAGNEGSGGTETPETCNHVDVDCDYICDNCGETYCRSFTDYDSDGNCEYCGKKESEHGDGNEGSETPETCNHVDSDNNGSCDLCNIVMSDETTPGGSLNGWQGNFADVPENLELLEGWEDDGIDLDSVLSSSHPSLTDPMYSSKDHELSEMYESSIVGFKEYGFNPADMSKYKLKVRVVLKLFDQLKNASIGGSDLALFAFSGTSPSDEKFYLMDFSGYDTSSMSVCSLTYKPEDKVDGSTSGNYRVICIEFTFDEVNGNSFRSAVEATLQSNPSLADERTYLVKSVTIELVGIGSIETQFGAGFTETGNTAPDPDDISV